MSNQLPVGRLRADVEVDAARKIAAAAQIGYEDARRIVWDAQERFDLQPPAVAAVAAMICSTVARANNASV